MGHLLVCFQRILMPRVGLGVGGKAGGGGEVMSTAGKVTKCPFCIHLQVYHRLQTKPSLAEKLDKYLENFNKSGQIFLGSFKLSLKALGKSKSLLRQFLLQNPHLSDSQYQLVLKLYGVAVGGNQDCGEKSALLADAFHLSQTKAAFKILCKMRDRLTEDMAPSQDKTLKASSRAPLSNAEEYPSAVSSEEVCMDATVHCLFKHVEHLLKFGGNLIGILDISRKLLH